MSSPEQARWFSEHVHPHEPALRAYLSKRFPTLPDHDDLVQETYVRVLRVADPARRTGVTISFQDIFYLRPSQISVRDGATGAVVDPYSLSSYVLTSATDNSSEAADLKRSAYENIRRNFSVRGIPVSLKAGAEMQQSMRDVRTLQPPFTFVGADGRATTTPTAAGGSDDGATALLDPGVSQQYAPFGFPQVQWIDNYKLWNLYKAHPEYFTIDRNSAYSAETQASKHAEEVVSSTYFRGDVSFFNRRLKLVGGVRAEQTNIKAEGPIIDPTRNFRRDAKGDVAVLRDANGNPILGANRLKQPELIEPTTINLKATVERDSKTWR